MLLGTIAAADRPRSPLISPFASLNLSRSAEELAGHGLLNQDAATDVEALIRVELDIISPTCPTNNTEDETLHIANIQFNNLDVVGELGSCFVNTCDEIERNIHLNSLESIKSGGEMSIYTIYKFAKM